jgi:hypothetical protein
LDFIAYHFDNENTAGTATSYSRRAPDGSKGSPWQQGRLGPPFRELLIAVVILRQGLNECNPRSSSLRKSRTVRLIAKQMPIESGAKSVKLSVTLFSAIACSRDEDE